MQIPTKYKKYFGNYSFLNKRMKHQHSQIYEDMEFFFL